MNSEKMQYIINSTCAYKQENCVKVMHNYRWQLYTVQIENIHNGVYLYRGYYGNNSMIVEVYKI